MRNRANHAKNFIGFLLNIMGALALGTAQVCAQGIITTMAGNGSRGFSGDGGPAANALLNIIPFTGGVSADAAGNVYIADTGNHRVRKIDPSGIISTVAGNGSAKFSGDGGPATSAALNVPSGLATDSAGNLYIVDGGNQRIRKVSPDGRITTVAGNGVAGLSGDAGPATSASLHFNRYSGNCAVDTAGNLYIADTENHRVRKVQTDGTITSVASAHWPYSVAVDSAGAVYIGGEDGLIDKVGAVGTPFVATGLNVPAGVAIDHAGNLYIADSHNHRVRKAAPNGAASIIAGSGDPIFGFFDGYVFVGGFSGDGGPATNAQLNFPWGVAVDATGNIYIADSANNRIRKVTAAPNDNQSTFSSSSPFLLHGLFEPDISAITVSGLAGTVSKVTASINFGDHGAPAANLAFTLVGPNGESSTLMSGVGVNKPFGLTFTFDDAAPSSLTTNPASGTYKPTSPLSVFTGTSPNGVWKLYAVNFVSDPACSILGENCTVVGVWSLTITTAPALPNQIDDAQFFVRQHYRDFLNREADSDGLNFWTGEIFICGSDPQCIEVKRINDSASFFLSIEFQETGYLVYRMYRASYGNLPNTPVPIKFDEFLSDTQEIGKNVIVRQTGWELILENNKQALAAAFVQRQRFVAAYPTLLSPDAFVDALFANAGVIPSSSDRTAAIIEFGAATNSGDVDARARALRRVAENSTFAQQEFNRAFVLMQYFGYLRRNPNDAPDGNFDGYNFWLNKLNQFHGDFIQAEMVKAFLQSSEYRQRFGP